MACFTIKYFGSSWILISYTGMQTVEIVMIYCAAYQNAFQIPEDIKKMKKLMVQLARLGPKNQLRRLQMQVTAIPLVGVKVGDFHLVERMSTPNFIHFFLIQVANLLLIFR